MSSETKYMNSSYEDFFEKSLQKTDPDLFKAINDELVRQQNHIELIASENIVSKAVLEAQGSVLTNKYSEGLPGKRYYGGCVVVDEIEDLCRERLKNLFGEIKLVFTAYITIPAVFLTPSFNIIFFRCVLIV